MLTDYFSFSAIFCFLSPDTSDYHDLEPGAIPVATAVYDAELHPTPPMPTAPVAPAPLQQQERTVLVGIPDPTLSRNPMMMRQCRNCQQESRTRIRTFPAWQTWLSSAVLVSVFWPICWIPLVMDSCKKTEHFCVMWYVLATK
jgi:hypothetical protein